MSTATARPPIKKPSALLWGAAAGAVSIDSATPLAVGLASVVNVGMSVVGDDDNVLLPTAVVLTVMCTGSVADMVADVNAGAQVCGKHVHGACALEQFCYNLSIVRPQAVPDDIPGSSCRSIVAVHCSSSCLNNTT